MTSAIRFSDPLQANWVTNLLDRGGNGAHVELDGHYVTLTAEALVVLADLPEDHDGHYDGTHVWIGGTEYVVRHLP